MTLKFAKSDLHAFQSSYDTSQEDKALNSRGAFLRAFPKNALGNLAVDDYVIGLKRPTFCDFVEAKTRSWAYIQGATSFKFGIYFGRTKSDLTCSPRNSPLKM